jgi:DnaJ-domain-containing protein 1
MGILDRLGNVIRSYVSSDDSETFRSGPRFSDPDLAEAYDELNDYLNRGGKSGASRPGTEKNTYSRPGTNRPKPPPESLRPDFAELGLPFGASAEDCKAAYKKLLKIHHPDRHTSNANDFKKATEKSARINAAYDHIEKWRQGR